MSEHYSSVKVISFKWLLLTFFSGAMVPLCFSPFDQITNFSAYLIYPLISLFFIQIRQSHNLKSVFIKSWAFGFGLFLTGISWVYVAIHEFGSTPWWLAGFFTLLFITALSLFFAFQGVASLFLMQEFNKRGLSKNSYKSDWVAYLLVFPIIWIIFEWLRSWVLTGLPWLLVGYSQLSTPLAGFAPVVGVYGLSLLTATIAAALILLFNRSLSAKSIIGRLVLIVILISVFVSGYYLQKKDWTHTLGNGLKISMVQGNISQHNRWNNNFLKSIKQRYYDLSRALWQESDILIWPENAIPVFYQYEQHSFFKKIKQKVMLHDISFISGVPFLNREQGKYYNSLLRMEKQSNAFYFKQHLVPFGEYLPMEQWLRGLIKFFNIPMSGYSLPPADQEIMTIKGIPVAITLCYEDIFPELLLKQLPQAQFLLNLSNNGWYGNSLAPHQHLQIARMRALESGRELIRSTTSGISALIDHKGRIMKQSKQFETAVLSGTIQPRVGSTPFVHYGNRPLLAYVLFILCAMLLFSFKKFSRSSINKRFNND
jgi:apolipoprotein N-acyltransferase